MTQPDRAAIDYAPQATSDSPRHAWIDPLVAGAIYALGVGWIAGWPRSFAGADDRIALAGPAAAVVAAVGGFAASRRSRVAAWTVPPLAGLAAMVATAPTLWPLHEQARWTPPAFAFALAGVAVVGAIAWSAIRFIVRRGAGGVAMLVLFGMAAATGGLALMTGSMRIAEKTWPLAIALCVATAAGAAMPRRRASAGVSTFAIAVVTSQLTSAHLWSELGPWQAACVLVAPAVAAATLALPIVSRRRPWLRGAIVLIVAATPAIVACALAAAEAYRASQSSGADGASDYGY